MTLGRSLPGAAGALLLALPVAAKAAPIEVRVVVVTTFEEGADEGDKKGEFQNWVERLPLPDKLPFPQGYRGLRYNPANHVLGIVTGEGKSHAAASITALADDPRFDVTHAYWILAGIGGIDPAAGSIGSAAWARYVVDGDLAFEVDAREMPSDWSTGIVPYDRPAPFAPPVPPLDSENGEQAFVLNAGLVDWAYGFTKDIEIPDNPKMASFRALYVAYPNAQKPPFVLEGDTLTADRFWIGEKMTVWARQWVAYWTAGKGVSATSAEEDTGYLQALTMLSHAGKVDRERVLDLRTASDFTLPPPGISPATLLAQEAHGDYAGYDGAIESAYLVGSKVVTELAGHWDIYKLHPPGSQ